MLEAAVAGLAEGSGGAPAGILGVTVLTSLEAPDLQKLGIQKTPGELVARRAKVAQDTGCEGVVCSPKELVVVGDVAPTLIRCTPGIRMKATQDDQMRTATPEEAVARGADLLVIGRPITEAADPAAAARDVQDRILAATGSG